ncbi:hypothetical protein [Hyphomonas sp.]|uniref:hypothetical protein n=1 Tax=Hyphomonas sp. TaxID=87 RepID=UPI003297F25C
MVSVFVNNAFYTKKAVVIINFVVLGLAVVVQATVSGNISEIVRSALPSLNSAVALDSNFSVAPSSSTSPTLCLSEAMACVLDDSCYDCAMHEDDDESNCEAMYFDCEELWDELCCTYGQDNATCIDNEPLFDFVGECSNCGGVRF